MKTDITYDEKQALHKYIITTAALVEAGISFIKISIWPNL